ncbi:MAG: hypothetical protein JW757_12130 [Anaerolineales bacterium]|nr:hypothetical protein [Anaerolineales bacterium]
MLQTIGSDIINSLGIILAVGMGWIILRFIFKLARKVFQLGCLAIVIIGALVLINQYIQ